MFGKKLITTEVEDAQHQKKHNSVTSNNTNKKQIGTRNNQSAGSNKVNLG